MEGLEFDINFEVFKLILAFNLTSRYAVEISDQKILIFQKFGISTFTEKKNQVFWTRIDYFRNDFGTPAYPDVTWSVSLKTRYEGERKNRIFS